MNPVDDALASLDKHGAECALRYQMIQLQLDEHHRRFDRLEKMMPKTDSMGKTVLILN
mgnify:CR=1 FL=1